VHLVVLNDGVTTQVCALAAAMLAQTRWSSPQTASFKQVVHRWRGRVQHPVAEHAVPVELGPELLASVQLQVDDADSLICGTGNLAVHTGSQWPRLLRPCACYLSLTVCEILHNKVAVAFSNSKPCTSPCPISVRPH
jgi:hypothetical protein